MGVLRDMPIRSELEPERLCLPEAKKLSHTARIVIHASHRLYRLLPILDLTAVLEPALSCVQLGYLLPQEDKLAFKSKARNGFGEGKEALILS